ncbi:MULTISPECIES: DoxX family membrane protein [Lentzea]|uniref:DoxX protein n=1 Tax=Lentzea albida TaxID=65499 RepID=A0A1H9XE02_9PSEU|nr:MULTISPECIES: DoxX family membrane protein [Lentzea]USX53788.1 DoxX family membrane protein [Lentzea sp. HUAS12]SES44375.1 DoxX protein [Lentzea albida]
MISRSLLRQLPARITTGAYVLNSGLGKLHADQQAAESMHGWAANTYPLLGKLDPQRFAKLLAAGEIATGVALLVPLVPGIVAGAALTGFGGALLGLYLKTPGMRQERSLRPTEQGISLAKDVWLVGIGLSLVLDDVMREER